MNRRFSFFIFCALVVGFSARASVDAEREMASADEDNRRLIGVISSGLDRAFKIDSQRLQLEQAQNKRKISYAALLPTLNLLSTRTYGGTDTPVVGGQWTYTAAPVDQLRLSANWTVWDGFQAITNVKTSETQLQSTKVASDIQVQTFIVSLLQAYYTFELAVAARDIQAAQVDQSRLTSDQSQALVKAGVKGSLDARDAEIQLANDEITLMDRETAIVTSARSLQALVNAPKTADLPQLDLLKFEPYYMRGFDDALEKIRTKMQTDDRRELSDINPDLKKARIDLQTQAINLTQTKLSYFPKTSIVLMHDLNFDGYANNSATLGQGTQPIQNYSVGLSLSWQFWDWLSTPYQIANSQKDYDIALNTFHDTDVSARAGIENLISQIDLSAQAIRTLKVVVQKSESQLKLSEEMYRSGRINLLNMQQATNRVSQARNDMANRLADRYLKAAQLLYATGSSLLPPNTQVSWMR